MSSPTKPTPNLLQAGCPSCRLNLCMLLLIVYVHQCWLLLTLDWINDIVKCLSVCLPVCLSLSLCVFVCLWTFLQNLRTDLVLIFWVNSSRLCMGQIRLEYWAPVSEFAPHNCEEQIRVQALNLLRLLWIVQSTVCPCLFTEICTCCFLFAVIQTLHLIVIVLIFNRGPSGHLHYITCRSYPSKTGKYMPFKKIAKQHAGNKAIIALCFPIWLVVL